MWGLVRWEGCARVAILSDGFDNPGRSDLVGGEDVADGPGWDGDGVDPVSLVFLILLFRLLHF